jgi:hypothetical protein
VPCDTEYIFGLVVRRASDRVSASNGWRRPQLFEGVKKSPDPVILSEAKNLHLFALKEINADSSLRSE